MTSICIWGVSLISILPLVDRSAIESTRGANTDKLTELPDG